MLDLVLQNTQRFRFEVVALNTNKFWKVETSTSTSRPDLPVTYGNLGQGLRLFRREEWKQWHKGAHLFFC